MFNLSLLGFFKYTNFFLENLNLVIQVFGANIEFNPLHVLLPLALSFITFQQVAFLVDCYTHQTESISINFLDYALFISFFPQLIAGPIVHHKEILPQLKHLASSHAPDSRHIDWETTAKGLFIFFIGLFKKVFIADGFGKWADAGFQAVENGQILNLFESWATCLCYTFELYFDFSGYCDMAIGLGLLFGVSLPLNFNSPYKALNITDFWRRWHITLGRFFKQYLYIPLGGNQNNTFQHAPYAHFLNQLLTLRNLFIVAFLSGVWHGAGFGFIIWGSLHGLAMVTHRIYQWFIQHLEHRATTAQEPHCPLSLKHRIALRLATCFLRFREGRAYLALCWILTFFFVSIAWAFFRAPSLSGALNLLSGMLSTHIILPTILQPYVSFLHPYGIEFGLWAESIIESSFVVFGWLALAFILCLCGANSTQWMKAFKPNWSFLVVLAILSLVSFNSLNKVQQFLYFNF